MKINKLLLNRLLNWKVLLILFLATNLVYATMLLKTIPAVMTHSEGMKLLDMMPMGYNSDYVNTLFSALGESGRSIYLSTQIPLDMVYPFLFAISYSLIILHLLRKFTSINQSIFYLSWIPIIAGISDYLENVGIISMLSSYPDLSSFQTSGTNVFTIIKSLSTTVYFVSLLIILLALLFLRIKKRVVLRNN